MSARTAESITEEETFTRLVRAVPELRARVTLDREGWPMVPARFGRLEWRGVAAEAAPALLYAFTDSSRILSRLLAVPGVSPCQVGDGEGAVSMAATDHQAILACGRLLHCQTNGRASNGRSAEDMAAIRPAQVPA